MSLNFVLPNGVTIGFNSEAERDAYLSSAAGAGAQSQESLLAQNPGKSLGEITDGWADAWNSPGGQGYANAMSSGYNDPTSNPNNPTPFTPQQLGIAGLDPQAYYDRYASTHYGSDGGVHTWGINADREALNRQLYDYLVAKGYSPDLSAFGQGQFQQWLRYQPQGVQADANNWLAQNDPRAGGGIGGSTFQGTSGASTSPGVRPMRDMQWPRVAASQYLPNAQQQGMATYGSDGLGEADFGLSKRYMVPLLYDYLNATYAQSGGNRTIGRAHGGPVDGPGTGTSDSVPARLSDGEFVFTAQAVRGAGDGSRRDGAKRLYAAMKDMERRAGR